MQTGWRAPVNPHRLVRNEAEISQNLRAEISSGRVRVSRGIVLANAMAMSALLQQESASAAENVQPLPDAGTKVSSRNPSKSTRASSDLA